MFKCCACLVLMKVFRPIIVLLYTARAIPYVVILGTKIGLQNAEAVSISSYHASRLRSMTRLDTKYNAAKNWSARLPVARDIWHEVKAEREQEREQITEQEISDNAKTSENRQ